MPFLCVRALIFSDLIIKMSLFGPWTGWKDYGMIMLNPYCGLPPCYYFVIRYPFLLKQDALLFYLSEVGNKRAKGYILQEAPGAAEEET